MKELLLAFTLAIVASHANAQDASSTEQARMNAPATKLEAFSSRTGIVVVKGFTTVGALSGMGRVSVDAREFRDASNPKLAQYGIAFEVKESGRLDRENTSYVDEDELDSLLRGIDYISRIDKGVTTLGNFEAQYRTKGDLALTVFSSQSGEISLAVSSGRIARTSAYLKLSDAEKIRQMVLQARELIARARQTAR